jgi:hypothetical protein
MTKIEPSAQRQKIRVPPGSLYTGKREYACDGAILEAIVEGTRKAPHVVQCEILELHDFHVGPRRTSHDVGAFLRRCLRRLRSEGMILVFDEQILAVPADRIVVQKLRFQQFCSRSLSEGPFSSSQVL